MVILNSHRLTVRINYGAISVTFLSLWLLLVYFPKRYQAGEEWGRSTCGTSHPCPSSGSFSLAGSVVLLSSASVQERSPLIKVHCGLSCHNLETMSLFYSPCVWDHELLPTGAQTNIDLYQIFHTQHVRIVHSTPGLASFYILSVVAIPFHQLSNSKPQSPSCLLPTSSCEPHRITKEVSLALLSTQTQKLVFCLQWLGTSSSSGFCFPWIQSAQRCFSGSFAYGTQFTLDQFCD